jgi:hypothetical protein
MALKTCTAALAAAVIAMAAFAGPPAAAAQKKKSASKQTEQVASNRARTRVTVQRRSYLDAGTQVLPGERKFLDYAFPPYYSPLQVLGPGQDFRRRPLLDPWDFPGTSKY